MRSAAEWSGRRHRAVEAVQQALELEARLEHAPAGLRGAIRRIAGQALQATLDQEQAGGEHEDGDDQQRRAHQPRAAAGAHVTSIAVSCQIERWR